MRRRTILQKKQYSYDAQIIYYAGYSGVSVQLFGYKFDTSQIEYIYIGDNPLTEAPSYTIPTSTTSTGEEVHVFIKFKDLDSLDLSYMFYGCTRIDDFRCYIDTYYGVLPSNNLYISDSSYMFAASSICSCFMSRLNFVNVDTMKSMFYNAKTLSRVSFGSDINPNADLTNVFSLANDSGNIEYPSTYASNYTNLLYYVPSGWTKTAESI
jgi:hypothetical protein